MATTFTSLRIFAERVIKGIEGNLTDENRWDTREVIRMVRDAINAFLFARINQSIKDGDSVSEHYLGTYRSQAIKYDEELDMYYTDLPATYLSLYNHQGIQHIVPIDKNNRRCPELIPIGPHEEEIYRNLPAEALEGQFCYEPDRDKIWYPTDWNGQTIDKKFKSVDMTLCTIDFENVDDNEQLQIPPEIFEPVFDSVTKKCMELLHLPTDKTNDNQPVL